jgi:hypothetical protein
MSEALPEGDHNLRLVFVSGGYVSLDTLEVLPAPLTLGAGTYDDANQGISYSGSWLSMSGVMGPSGGTLRYSYRLGDAIQTYFSGQQIKLSFFAGPTAGIADVYIDGAKVVSIDEHSDNWEWQKTWTSDVLAAGTHSLRIVFASGPDGGFTSLDTLQVLDAPTILAPGTYDDGDPAFLYTGNWLTMNSTSGPYQDTLHYTYSIGDTAQVAFTGRQIQLSYFAGPDAGIVDIYIDGVKVTSLDQHSDNWTWQQIWTSELLAEGAHSLRIVYATGPVGTGFGSIDSIVVMP